LLGIEHIKPKTAYLESPNNSILGRYFRVPRKGYLGALFWCSKLPPKEGSYPFLV